MGRYPGARWDPIGSRREFATGYAPKGVLHTTEGTSYAGARSAYRSRGVPPHFTVSFEDGTFRAWQHIDTALAAHALRDGDGGILTDRGGAIQIGCVGTCNPANRGWGARFFVGSWPNPYKDGLARLMRWVELTSGVQRRAVSRWKPYPASYGDNGVRIDAGAWSGFNGWCFPAGTLITCDRGQVPIEAVRPGDRVLTHRGRYMPVTGITQRVAPVLTLHGRGHPGLRTTAEHPLLTLPEERSPRMPPGDLPAPGPGREWVPAARMVGRRWATPAVFPAAEVPEVGALQGEGARFVPDTGPELLRVTGRWVADGRLVGAGRIVVAAHPRDADGVLAMLRDAGWRSITVTRDLPAKLISVRSMAFARWLRAHFGDHPHLRQVPPWLLGAHEKFRQAFMDGYRSGGERSLPERAGGGRGVARPLAIGLHLLASSLEEGDPPGRLLGDHRYRLVDALTPGGPEVQVHNLAVAEDESFVADGIVVHNCGHQHVPGNCVTPGTPILCADLAWRAAGELRAGERVVAFDEDGGGAHWRVPGPGRRFRTAMILRNDPARKDCLTVHTDKASVTASADHPWLVRRGAGARARFAWVASAGLRAGDELAWLAGPWRPDTSWEAGWLAGLLDAGGWVAGEPARGVRLGITPPDGASRERVIDALRARGLPLAGAGRAGGAAVHIAGLPEQLRCLGTIRPRRFMDRELSVLWEGRRVRPHASVTPVEVREVEPAGEREIAGVTTSTGTFVTGGFLTHNTHGDPGTIDIAYLLGSEGDDMPSLEEIRRVVREEAESVYRLAALGEFHGEATEAHQRVSLTAIREQLDRIRALLEAQPPR